MNNIQVRNANAKKTAVAEYLKGINRPASKKEIVEATHITGIFDAVMREVRKTFPNIEKIGNTVSTKYVWRETEEKRPEPKRESVFYNASGYKDPVAGAALSNVMKSSGRYPEPQRFGEFWRTAGNNEYEGLLVITAKNGIAIGCFVHGMRKGFMSPEHTFVWSDGTGKHFCSLLHLVNYQTRNLTNRITCLPDETKTELRKLLGLTLGYDVTTEVKTKVVTKVETEVREVGMKEEEVQKLLDEQEAEAEKKIEALKRTITELQEETKAQLLQQKVDIYEKLLFQKGIA